MFRLCPTLLLGCAIAFGCFGCSGQNLEGRWKGALPYEDAKDCRIRMFGDGRFDVACAQDSWVGAGTYALKNDRITFTYQMLTRSGRALERPAALEFELDGRGNQLVLTYGPATEYRWVRTLEE